MSLWIQVLFVIGVALFIFGSWLPSKASQGVGAVLCLLAALWLIFNIAAARLG